MKLGSAKHFRLQALLLVVAALSGTFASKGTHAAGPRCFGIEFLDLSFLYNVENSGAGRTDIGGIKAGAGLGVNKCKLDPSDPKSTRFAQSGYWLGTTFGAAAGKGPDGSKRFIGDLNARLWRDRGDENAVKGSRLAFEAGMRFYEFTPQFTHYAALEVGPRFTHEGPITSGTVSVLVVPAGGLDNRVTGVNAGESGLRLVWNENIRNIIELKGAIEGGLLYTKENGGMKGLGYYGETTLEFNTRVGKLIAIGLQGQVQTATYKDLAPTPVEHTVTGAGVNAVLHGAF